MNMNYKIRLNTLESAKHFVNICSKFEEDIDYKIGRYIIDAKSILGILSTDLTKEAIVEFYSNDANSIYKFETLIDGFRTDVKYYS